MAPGQREGDERRAGLRRRGHPVPHVAPRSSSSRQPAVYFGEELGGYVVVGSKQRELNFEDEDETKYTTYEGEDGVALDNIIKKAAFALRFGDVNPLISDQLTGSSRVLYIRDIRERVSALAPFLDLDADPYPVIHDGRIVWIVDAYTTTSRYPYAQRVETGQLPDESGLDHTFNYVRNSVKAVVDAYDGTVDFYVMPVEDPIIDAYRDAFPGLFKDFEEMPEDLQAHLRYPEDLFRLQSNSWAKYHVTEADSFYQGNDFWDVALDPGTGAATPGRPTASSTTTHDHRRLHAGQPHRTGSSPYYLFTKLPGATDAGVRAPAAVRARAGERRQPAHDGVHGGQERRRELRAAPGVHDAAEQPPQRSRPRPGRDPEQRRGVAPGEPARSGRLARQLRQPGGHPDRQRARVGAAVLRHLDADASCRASAS